jgi:osomolarity two-component system response regulator SSK1
MQALIDFDGWRKWKDFSQNTLDNDAAKKMTVAAKAKPKKNRMSLGGGLGLNGPVGKGLKPDLQEVDEAKA